MEEEPGTSKQRAQAPFPGNYGQFRKTRGDMRPPSPPPSQREGRPWFSQPAKVRGSWIPLRVSNKMSQWWKWRWVGVYLGSFVALYYSNQLVQRLRFGIDHPVTRWQWNKVPSETDKEYVFSRISFTCHFFAYHVFKFCLKTVRLGTWGTWGIYVYPHDTYAHDRHVFLFEMKREGRLPPELLRKEYEYEKLARAKWEEDPYETDPYWDSQDESTSFFQKARWELPEWIPTFGLGSKPAV